MKKYFYILGISFILSLTFVLLAGHPMQSDSYGYDAIGVNLAAGNGYRDGAGELTMSREPIYPLFLAAGYKIFGHRYFPIQMAQIALFLLTVILVYRIAYLSFDRRIALYSMVITAFFPTLINYPAYILSETIFTFLLALFVYLCMKIYHTEKLIYYILAGAALALSTLCKAVMLPFIFILLIWMVLTSRAGKVNIRRKIIKAGIMVFIYMAIITPWMYRNYTLFGSFSLRQGSEGALCVKVQKLSYDSNDFKQHIVFMISESFGKKIYPDIVENPRDFLFKEDILVREKILPELRKKDYSAKEIKGMMMAEIKRRPFKFLAISTLDLLRMTQFTYFPLLIYEESLIKRVTELPHGRLFLSLSRGIFRLFAYILILLSIVGAIIRRKMWRNWLLLAALICYTDLVYSLIYGHGRYGVPLIPYYIILSAPVVVAIVEKMKGMIKCQK